MRIQPLRSELLAKYDVPTPRYTSYPTVPYWDGKITAGEWRDHVKKAFDRSNSTEGISLYLHLPFCEKLCTYCGCNKRITKNHAVEEPYIAALLKEWSYYRRIMGGRPRIAELHLGGGTPTFFSAANLDLLLKGILHDVDVVPGAVLSVEVHPNYTDREKLQVMYDHGLRRISVGVQDLDRKVQFVINRIQTFEKTKETFDLAREIGYTSINADIIHGLPLQTSESVRYTIEKMNGLRPERIAFYSYAHVPWKSKAQRRYTEADLPSGEEKRALYEIGSSMLLREGYLPIGMDHFALPEDELSFASASGMLHRNFMGYTPRHTELLIGLGASSISDTGTAFMQNVKEVEEYEEIVEADRLPLLKGHALSGTDMFFRKQISALMCRHRTEWEAEDAGSMEDAMERLLPLAADGLVELGDRSIGVTTAGEPFLRNIAMCLDAQLWAKRPSAPLFSRSI